MQHRPCSGSSGRSTRSRRDEVWEVKRQRWLAKNQGGGGCSGQQQRRPPSLGDLSGLGAGGGVSGGPKSPLSRFVEQGYAQPQTQQTPQQQQQPYYSDQPMSRGSGGLPTGGGFDGAVAGQWNANVQNGVMDRQSRHDPSVSGPSKAHSGQRISQPSGGHANIDLSWGGQQPAVSSHPPRMPGSGGSSGGSNSQYGAPPGQYGAAPQGMNYGAQAYAEPRHARGPSPGPASHRSASCPWGRDDNPAPTGRGMQGQQATPYGADAMQQQMQMQPGMMRSGSRGPRGASPAPMQQYSSHGGATPSSQYGGGDVMAAGGPRGRQGVFRPPGGQSSVVFG